MGQCVLYWQPTDHIPQMQMVDHFVSLQVWWLFGCWWLNSTSFFLKSIATYRIMTSRKNGEPTRNPKRGGRGIAEKGVSGAGGKFPFGCQVSNPSWPRAKRLLEGNARLFGSWCLAQHWAKPNHYLSLHVYILPLFHRTQGNIHMISR